MSSAIQFLERLGGDATLSRISAADYAAAVAALDAEPEVRRALLERDTDALNRALGGRPRMLCALVVPQDDNKLPEQEERRDDDDCDTPERDTE